jgi:hypothetical protein
MSIGIGISMALGGAGGGERVSPTCIVSSSAADNVELPYSVTFTFSEDVTGFAGGDITVVNGTAGTFATVSASVYTATITPISPGSVTVQVAAGVCADLAGNLNSASNVLSRTYVMLQLSAVTSGAGQTVTLQRITPTGAAVTVNWGDGSTSSIANGNTGTTTHVYASAGTYAITISNPAILTYVDLRDTKLSFNSSTLVNCTALAALRIEVGGIFNSYHLVALPLTFLAVSLTIAGTYTFNSAHIAAMALTFLSVRILTAGTCTFDSAHIAAMALTSLDCTISIAGTYTFNSAHIAAMALTFLSVNMQVEGTYTFNSAHIAAMALTVVYAILTIAGTYTFNSAHIAAMATLAGFTVVLHTTNTTAIARADWDGFPALTTLRFEAGLSSAKLTDIGLGLHDGLATRTAVNGTIDLVGQSNLAPTGVSPGSAECPPTTGYNAFYELVNDSCAVNPTKKWASAQVP